jgi:hypothetical protein
VRNGASAVHSSAEVDVDGAAPLFVGERDESLLLGYTGVAHENVDLPESLRGGGDGLLDGLSL